MGIDHDDCSLWITNRLLARLNHIRIPVGGSVVFTLERRVSPDEMYGSDSETETEELFEQSATPSPVPPTIFQNTTGTNHKTNDEHSPLPNGAQGSQGSQGFHADKPFTEAPEMEESGSLSPISPHPTTQGGNVRTVTPTLPINHSPGNSFYNAAKENVEASNPPGKIFTFYMYSFFKTWLWKLIVPLLPLISFKHIFAHAFSHIFILHIIYFNLSTATEEASSTPLSPGAARAAALERRRLKQLQQELEETPAVVVALPPPPVATETVTKPLPNPVTDSVINSVMGRSVSPPPSPPPLTPSMLRKNQLQERVYTSSADSGDQEVSHIDWHEENIEVEVEDRAQAERTIANRYDFDFLLVFGLCYVFF